MNHVIKIFIIFADGRKENLGSPLSIPVSFLSSLPFPVLSLRQMNAGREAAPETQPKFFKVLFTSLVAWIAEVANSIVSISSREAFAYRELFSQSQSDFNLINEMNVYVNAI